MVTSGVSGGLQLVFMAMINPGDEVIIPDPYFVIYKHMVNILGGRCVFVDSYPDFELPVEKIKQGDKRKDEDDNRQLTCNPTGAVYSAESLKELAETAAKKNIVILSDEIYEKFCYEHKQCLSMRSTVMTLFCFEDSGKVTR